MEDDGSYAGDGTSDERRPTCRSMGSGGGYSIGLMVWWLSIPTRMGVLRNPL